MKDQDKTTCCEKCRDRHELTPYGFCCQCNCHQAPIHNFVDARTPEERVEDAKMQATVKLTTTNDSPPIPVEGWVREAADKIWNAGGKLTHNDIDEILFSLLSSERQRMVEKVWDALFDSYPSDMENFDVRTESQSHRLLESFWTKLEALTDKEELKD